MKIVLNVLKVVLSKPPYIGLAILITIIFLSIFVAVPVYNIPGNDLQFQLSLYTLSNYIKLILLALLIAITFTIQIYGLKNKRKTESKAGLIIQAPATGITGVMAAVLGTAACAFCIAPIFLALGLGTGALYFVLDNQPYFLAGAFIILLASLYFAAHSVNKNCKEC